MRSWTDVQQRDMRKAESDYLAEVGNDDLIDHYVRPYIDYLLRKRAMLDENGSGIIFQRRLYLYAGIALGLQGVTLLVQGATGTFHDPNAGPLFILCGCLLLGCAILLLAFRPLLTRVDRRDRAVCQAVLDANPSS